MARVTSSPRRTPFPRRSRSSSRAHPRSTRHRRLDAPLDEGATAADRGRRHTVARSSLAEGVALEARARGHTGGVVRAFNHTGPGQRPRTSRSRACARSRLAARSRGDDDDRRRERRRAPGHRRRPRRRASRTDSFSSAWSVDGRLIESSSTSRRSAVRLRSIIEELGRLAGIEVMIRRDESLVRAGEPDRIVGDATALRQATGWRPSRTARG